MAEAPDPTTPIAVLPGWWFRTGCPRCRLMVDVPLGRLVDRGLTGTVAETAQRLRCRRCGAAPAEVVLTDSVTGMPDYGGEARPRVEVRVV